MQRLSYVLNACGLQINPVPGDGNSFFTAVATALISNKSGII